MPLLYQCFRIGWWNFILLTSDTIDEWLDYGTGPNTCRVFLSKFVFSLCFRTCFFAPCLGFIYLQTSTDRFSRPQCFIHDIDILSSFCTFLKPVAWASDKTVPPKYSFDTRNPASALWQLPNIPAIYLFIGDHISSCTSAWSLSRYHYFSWAAIQFHQIRIQTTYTPLTHTLLIFLGRTQLPYMKPQRLHSLNWLRIVAPISPWTNCLMITSRNGTRNLQCAIQVLFLEKQSRDRVRMRPSSNITLRQIQKFQQIPAKTRIIRYMLRAEVQFFYSFYSLDIL